MKSIFATLVYTLMAANLVSAQITAPGDDNLTTSTNEVQGLSLPKSFSVPFDEGFVTIKAEANGEVEWIVLSTTERVKYKVNATDKDIVIAIPPRSCVITVYCYGLNNGKLTKAARCDIEVKGDGKTPEPNPSPNPITTDKVIITLVEDPLKTDPTYTLLAKWLQTADKLNKSGNKVYRKSIKDPNTRAWLEQAANKDPNVKQAINLAGLPLIVIQDPAGKLLGVIPCPKTEEELFNILKGGK